VALDDGYDNLAYGNHMVSTGFLPGQWPDGGFMAATFSNGGVVWSSYGNPPSLYFDNVLTDNLSGWMRWNTVGGPVVASDYWLPDCDAGCVGNQDLSASVTPQDEGAEGARWLQKLADAGVTIGPVCP
jgi:hypothetical protein